MALEYEFCGAIYRVTDGFKATLPGTIRDTNHCRPPPVPEGTVREAVLHSHLQGESFSTPDREIGRQLSSLVLYLCTPTGLVKRMTPEGMMIVR
jgi:hypothetical protein